MSFPKELLESYHNLVALHNKKDSLRSQILVIEYFIRELKRIIDTRLKEEEIEELRLSQFDFECATDGHCESSLDGPVLDLFLSFKSKINRKDIQNLLNEAEKLLKDYKRQIKNK